MKKPIFKILGLIFIVAIISRWICSLPTVALKNDPMVPMTIKSGEAIFWGKGTCHVCHRIGDRGYALRGPDLGEGKEGAIIPARAKQRADSLQLTDGVNYLLQSIAQPEAFLVPGFNNEMPKVYQPPVSLYPSEIKAIVYYLLSLDGDSTVAALNLPETILAYYDAPQKSEFKLTGNAEAGERLYYNSNGTAACASCHTATDASGKVAGDKVGPGLSAIGLIRSPEHIYRKIIKPDSNIVSGYEDVLIITKKGRYLTGIANSENEEVLVLMTSTGEKTSVAKNEIRKRIPQKISNMPMNYSELLTEKQIQDLVAFLVGQKNGEADLEN